MFYLINPAFYDSKQRLVGLLQPPYLPQPFPENGFILFVGYLSQGMRNLSDKIFFVVFSVVNNVHKLPQLFLLVPALAYAYLTRYKNSQDNSNYFYTLNKVYAFFY
jgi:hypothetical protein